MNDNDLFTYFPKWLRKSTYDNMIADGQPLSRNQKIDFYEIAIGKEAVKEIMEKARIYQEECDKMGIAVKAIDKGVVNEI